MADELALAEFVGLVELAPGKEAGLRGDRKDSVAQRFAGSLQKKRRIDSAGKGHGDAAESAQKIFEPFVFFVKRVHEAVPFGRLLAFAEEGAHAVGGFEILFAHAVADG